MSLLFPIFSLLSIYFPFLPLSDSAFVALYGVVCVAIYTRREVHYFPLPITVIVTVAVLFLMRTRDFVGGLYTPADLPYLDRIEHDRPGLLAYLHRRDMGFFSLFFDTNSHSLLLRIHGWLDGCTAVVIFISHVSFDRRTNGCTGSGTI